MASLNKTELIGHLGQDPEMRYLPDGTPTATISIATTDKWKDKKTNEERESTEWHRVVFFRKTAEVVGQYLKRGAQVYVEGRLRTRKWEDKEGVERYITEVHAHKMLMLGSKKASDVPGVPRQDDVPPVSFVDDDDDSIPF